MTSRSRSRKRRDRREKAKMPREVEMPDVIIIGDGPGGLSAALFLAKNRLDVVVFGDDKSAMHYAHLRNYLGIPELGGSEFQRIARGQATGFGARLRDDRVASIARDGDRFTATLEGG